MNPFALGDSKTVTLFTNYNAKTNLSFLNFTLKIIIFGFQQVLLILCPGFIMVFDVAFFGSAIHIATPASRAFKTIFKGDDKKHNIQYLSRISLNGKPHTELPFVLKLMAPRGVNRRRNRKGLILPVKHGLSVFVFSFF